MPKEVTYSSPWRYALVKWGKSENSDNLNSTVQIAVTDEVQSKAFETLKEDIMKTVDATLENPARTVLKEKFDKAFSTLKSNYDNRFIEFDRAEIQKLIRDLKRARNATWGADE